MKRILMVFAATVFAAVMSIGDADAARRAGSGKNSGAQRDGVTQRQATPPAAAGAAAGAQQRSGIARFLGPIAAIAAGLGLAYLLGDQLGSVLMLLILVVGVVFLIRMFLAKRAGPQPAGAAAGNGQISQYQGTAQQPAPGSTAGIGGGASAVAAANVPAGFDSTAFANQAKQAFIQLQAANDKGDLEALKELTTDEMFNTIRDEISARGGVAQQVEVISLNAEVVEVVTEGYIHWASVRFSGALREDANSVPEKFVEVWNMKKTVDGSSGWLLAGIQQV
jgi:predicted lipid-binding transport protein (Tim44 family)